MPVRTVLRLPLEVEDILTVFFPKVILLKFWHVVDGLFMWALLGSNLLLS
jgi:hypothetical protein